MADFSPVVDAYLSGRTVNLRPLALFDLRDGELALWDGEYDLVSGGKTWKGLGAVASIEGLDQAATLESSAMTFTLSGLEKPGADFAAVARSADRANYVRRLVTVYVQFFGSDGEDWWQPLAEPFALKAGLMSNMVMSRSRTESGFLRTISLTANNIFYGRGVAPAAYYTDRDQQKRYPGDLGMQFIPTLQNKPIPVPWR